MDTIERKVLDSAKEYYGVATDEEARAEVIQEWGEMGLRGYGIFTDVTLAEHIERIDCLDVYASDIIAALQAKRDGIKLIPFRDQPKGEPFRYCRFIDTPENRALLGL